MLKVMDAPLSGYESAKHRPNILFIVMFVLGIVVIIPLHILIGKEL